MKQTFLALAVLLIISPLAKTHSVDAPQVHSFGISSLNTPFGMQGDFEGEYQIYADRIELKVTKANIYISEHCPYKGRRLLSGMKFGLAMSTGEKGWKITNPGQELFLEQIMSPGETHSLGELYFSIPTDPSVDLSQHWLVVQMKDIALDVPEEKRSEGYAFAHSCRDIFASTKQYFGMIP